MNKLKKILETFIFIAIVLVIVQTFLDDYSVYAMWDVKRRTILLISALIFDLIFSIEFVVRSVASAKSKAFGMYFFHRRGWVDFLSSFPLLLLSSAPTFYFTVLSSTNGGALLAGIGVLNVLKIVKVIRVTRILRLVRVIKIFGQIKNTDSPMAQDHVATATTTAVFTVILVLLFSGIFLSGTEAQILKKARSYEQSLSSIDVFIKNHSFAIDSVVSDLVGNDSDILKLSHGGVTIIEQSDDYIRNNYMPHDMSMTTFKDYEILFSVRDINASNALRNLVNFALILSVVIVFALVYSRHFAQTVTDVLFILNKGFRKKEYNLQIKIYEPYKNHEVYRLARFYNNAYLPAKMKKAELSSKKDTGGLSMDDFLKFGKK